VSQSQIFGNTTAALAVPASFTAHIDALAQIDWVVFCKPPFAEPEQVLGYLNRYTDRVAIANSRLGALDDGKVSFSWKDYRQDGKTKIMTLSADEFIRRFLQHTVPDGFHRIRHIGFLANCRRSKKLALCRDLLAAPPPPDAPLPRRWQDRLHDLTGQAIDGCPAVAVRCCEVAFCRPVGRRAHPCSATVHEPSFVASYPLRPARQRRLRRHSA